MNNKLRRSVVNGQKKRFATKPKGQFCVPAFDPDTRDNGSGTGVSATDAGVTGHLGDDTAAVVCASEITSNVGLITDSHMPPRAYEGFLLQSRFCLYPAGFKGWSPRLIDVSESKSEECLCMYVCMWEWGGGEGWVRVCECVVCVGGGTLPARLLLLVLKEWQEPRHHD